VEIRDARHEDWARIWPVFAETVRAGETYAYDPGLTSEQARALWVAPAPGATVVAVDGDDLLGTASMRPNRDGRGAHIGTASFMVAAQARGHGVGRALATHVVGWHREHGFRGIQFNAVVETNTAAVALWRSLGFTVVGTVPGAFDHPVHGFVGLHVMFLPLV
jgi:L-amino acid N-acyltransferase YncA